ncbi:MAG: PIG-L family deacetylase [Actinomycetota bacterium]
MATLVTFHAHPDDEAIATGGTMAAAVADGHRVVLVVATGGEVGEVDDGFLADGETLGDRRRGETIAAAEHLGVQRVEFLGYRDSGMMGEPTNDDPSCFWQADVDEAAAKLAALLEAESADVLTCYDDHGGYGHPDHIQVHRVGHRAAELAGTPRLYESTMNRDRMLELQAAAAEAGIDFGPDPDDDEADVVDMESFGTPEAQITTAVDVTAHLAAKRAAMAAHASQIGADSFFLQLPAEAFAMAFGIEHYIRVGAARAPDAPFETSVFGS